MLGRIFPVDSKRRRFLRRLLVQPKIPSHLESRFQELDREQQDTLKASLECNFFSKSPAGYLESEVGMEDLEAHLSGRLWHDREYIVPWLDASRRLEGSHILEIGCGTGASTAALAEQGARVKGVDIDELALKDAELRCSLHGLNVELFRANATQIEQLFSREKFDMVIFYASLEHMTHEERHVALRDAWALVPDGGLLSIIETPNRLWHFDSHTSNLPFFDWLPDEIAFQYSKFSPRERFNQRFQESTEELRTEFMRWGRGVSYHDFQLALGDIDLSTASCASEFVRSQRPAVRLKWRLSGGLAFEKMLRSQVGDISGAFFQPYLNLVMRKPGGH